jgi:[calcium/calmodulin-dependent protein kinase] kinase
MAQETLNARSGEFSDSDGSSQRRINQYTIKEEIGRGSFGAVFVAEDQKGTEYVSRPKFSSQH